MRQISMVGLTVVMALGWGSAAMAQDGEASPAKCPDEAISLSGEFATWAHPLPLVAATRPAELHRSKIVVGQAVLAEMKATPSVSYSARPADPGGKVSKGGIFQLAIKTAGTYSVAISGHSWIDVVAKGKSVPSSGHGPGPACSGIRKMVDFPLTAGLYTLQLSAGDQDKVTILVVPRAGAGKN